MKIFKSGDLVLYKTNSMEEGKLCIVLNHMFSDYDHFHKGQGASYFSCLIDNKIETICDMLLFYIK